MSRHTIYLSESDSKLLQELKRKHGSISKVIKVSLSKLREEQLKEYYQKKSETYPELRKAQNKVMERQDKGEGEKGSGFTNSQNNTAILKKMKYKI